MGYHIFLVGEENFNICLDRGMYGGPESKDSKKSEQMNSEIIASFMGIKCGDFVFFM